MCLMYIIVENKTGSRYSWIWWEWGFISCGINIILNIGLSFKVCKEQGAKYLVKLGKWIMPLTNILYYSIAIYCSINSIPMSTEQVTCVFIGMVFIISGNYFPKNHINPYIGMKFPWLLSDEISWNKTHKVAAYTWIFAGILMILYPFLKKKYLIFPLIVLLVGIIPLVYSLILVKSKKNKGDIK